MKHALLFIIFILTIIWVQSLLAQTKVFHIETAGFGRYSENVDPKDPNKGDSFIAKIPKVVREGEILTISYDNEGDIKEEEFEVQNIININTICRIHNKLVSEDGDFSGDVIYVEPCKVFKEL